MVFEIKDEIKTTVKLSPIHGSGLFALTDFKKGEVIMKAILPQTDYREGMDLMQYFGRTNDSGQYIKLGSLEFSVLRYLNHQKDCNAEYHDCIDNPKLLSPQYELVATKDITAGEEITINYGIEGFN